MWAHLTTREGFVLVSPCYLVLRWLLQLVALRVRSDEWKELEIVVLRHELAILRRQTRRPPITAVPTIKLIRIRELLATRSHDASGSPGQHRVVNCVA